MRRHLGESALTTATDSERRNVDWLELCVQELFDGMSWVTGPGSPIEAGAESGGCSEECQVIMGSWQVFKTNHYKVGRDQASDIDYDAVCYRL